jgi:hypothetical protein
MQNQVHWFALIENKTQHIIEQQFKHFYNLTNELQGLNDLGTNTSSKVTGILDDVHQHHIAETEYLIEVQQALVIINERAGQSAEILNTVFSTLEFFSSRNFLALALFGIFLLIIPRIKRIFIGCAVLLGNFNLVHNL